MSTRPRPTDRTSRRAYVFYATSDAYAVAVLVFARLLRRLGVRPDVELVVLHHSLSGWLVEAMRAAGIEPRSVAPLRGARGYFRDSLTKLRVLELTEYDRLVFADADALPLKPLDHLFELPALEPVAAPAAYWMPQPLWTSALLVVRPSGALRERIAHRLGAARRRRLYDMDILNAELAGEIHTLDPESFCLNSEWEDIRRPGYFPNPEEAFSRVSLIHFSALGKPWSFSPAQARRLRPHAHPAFYELYEAWTRTRDEVLRGIRERRAQAVDPLLGNPAQ